MTRAPRVSVLLPQRDAASTVVTALRSVRRQTFHDWECVIIDDGSRDQSAAMAEGFAARDGRFRVHREAHRGVVGALNHGIGLCRGDYIARFDADDVMHRERLALQVEALDREPLLAAVGCHPRFFPRAALGDGLRAYERWLCSIDSAERLRRDALIESPVGHPTLTLRRDVLSAFGYRDRPWPEDYDLILRVLSGGYEVGVVPRRLHSWRESPQRLTWIDPRCSIDAFVACKAAHLAETFLRDHPTYGLWGYGGTARALRRHLLVHGKKIAYVIDVHPGRVGNRIDGADVISPERLVSPPGVPLVVSVAGETPRAEIREFLSVRGLRELADFVCAA